MKYNNLINEKLSKYKHDFSICDIDGACRCFYKQDNEWKCRIVLYEAKYANEEATETQLATLYTLKNNINWQNFDEKSGVFLFRHDDSLQNIKIYKIIEINFQEHILEQINEITIDELYNWVSAKDKRI